jgi:hypothetical protein
VANGLALLADLKIISKDKNRSHYRIISLDVPGSWGKLPQQWLMKQPGHIFGSFSLRSKSELDALKIYLLLLAFRNDINNYAHIGYAKITEYTGVSAKNLKKAKSHLINLDLIHMEYDSDYAFEKASRPPLRYKILGLQKSP